MKKNFKIFSKKILNKFLILGEIIINRDIFNFEILENLTLTKSGYPIIKGIGINELDILKYILIPFNYAMSCKNKAKCGVHFYIDDYQFERIWKKPKLYLHLLKQFKFIIMPDFSLYKNFPQPLQMYNLYKSKLLAAYFENNGILVIPNVTWIDIESLSWTLDGIPKYSLIALSTNGCLNKNVKNNFIECYNKAMEILKPLKIIVIGELPEELKNDKRIINVKSHLQRLHKIKKGGKI